MANVDLDDLDYAINTEVLGLDYSQFPERRDYYWSESAALPSPKPSRDWSDLGRVIEKAVEAGVAYKFRLSHVLVGGGWYAEVRAPGCCSEFIKWATTPTEALARAILKAARARRCQS